jgi:hypothetical protein
MYCKRHEKAVYQIADAIKRSERGNCLIYMSAETQEMTLNDIPSWFPRGPNGTFISKPDIIIFPNTSSPTMAPGSSQKSAIIVEVGYTSDRKVTAKLTAKREQHFQLYQFLRGQGWQVPYVPIVIAYSGYITTTLREKLGLLTALSPPAIMKLLTRLQSHNCCYNQAILHTRYHTIKETPPAGVG